MRVAVQDVGRHVQPFGERELRVHQVQRRAEERGRYFSGESEADWVFLERFGGERRRGDNIGSKNLAMMEIYYRFCRLISKRKVHADRCPTREIAKSFKHANGKNTRYRNQHEVAADEAESSPT